jgi:formylmethanofuran dehydrogenase subunit E
MHGAMGVFPNIFPFRINNLNESAAVRDEKNRGFIMRFYLCSECMQYADDTSGEWVDGKFLCVDCAPHDHENDEGEK